MKLTFRLGEISGKKPDRVLPGLRFLRTPQRGRFCQLGNEFGPFIGQPVSIEKDLTHRVSNELLELIEAISLFQQHTVEQLVVPNLETLSISEHNEIIAVAKLLQGETLAVEILGSHIAPNGSALSDGDHFILLTSNREIVVGESVIQIGLVALHIARARITREHNETGQIDSVRVSPI